METIIYYPVKISLTLMILHIPASFDLKILFCSIEIFDMTKIMHPFKLLDSLSWAVGSMIVIAIFVAFVVAGIILLRKFYSTKEFRAHHDVAGFVFTNLGVLYAVLLGFTVVNVQQRFDRIKDTAHIEASFLMQLYRDSRVFAEKDRDAIRDALKTYALKVIEIEWPMLAEGKHSEEARQASHDIWSIYYTVDLTDQKQQIWYTESISKLNALMGARLERVLGSQESLSPEMWALLIIGGLVMLAFIWFFGVENILPHVLMAATLASATGFLLYLIYSLDTSFGGAIQISPDAFKIAVESLE